MRIAHAWLPEVHLSFRVFCFPELTNTSDILVIVPPSVIMSSVLCSISFLLHFNNMTWLHTHMCEAVELPGRSWPLAEGGASSLAHIHTACILYNALCTACMFNYTLYTACILYSPIMGPRTRIYSLLMAPQHTFQPFVLCASTQNLQMTAYGPLRVQETLWKPLRIHIIKASLINHTWHQSSEQLSGFGEGGSHSQPVTAALLWACFFFLLFFLSFFWETFIRIDKRARFTEENYHCNLNWSPKLMTTTVADCVFVSGEI